MLSHELFARLTAGGKGFDKTVASHYRKAILEKGSSEDADQMIASFLGRNAGIASFAKWTTAGCCGRVE